MAQNESNSMMDQGLDALLKVLNFYGDPVGTSFPKKENPSQFNLGSGIGPQDVQNYMDTNRREPNLPGLTNQAPPALISGGKGDPDDFSSIMRDTFSRPADIGIGIAEILSLISGAKGAKNGIQSILKSKFLNNERGR